MHEQAVPQHMFSDGKAFGEIIHHKENIFKATQEEVDWSIQRKSIGCVLVMSTKYALI